MESFEIANKSSVNVCVKMYETQKVAKYKLYNCTKKFDFSDELDSEKLQKYIIV
jgi:hypothetical protein